MFVCSQMKGSGKKLDIMDVLWHEMYAVVMARRVPVLAALIMKLIIHIWRASRIEHALVDNDEELTTHYVKSLLIKKHLRPLVDGEDDEDNDTGASDEDFELPKKDGFKRWMVGALHKIFCRQDNIEWRAYQAHKRSKEERKRSRERFEKLGVDVGQPGSEDRITSFKDWKSKQQWTDVDFLDTASSSAPWSRTVIGNNVEVEDVEHTKFVDSDDDDDDASNPAQESSEDDE